MNTSTRYNGRKLALSCMTAMAVVHCILPLLKSEAIREYLRSDVAVYAVAACLIAGLTLLTYIILARAQLSGSQTERENAAAMHGRSASIDLVRALAAFLACLVHVFTLCGYYQAPMNSRTMFVLTALRTVALLAVPLFMIITGYLCVGKTNIGKAYRNIGPFVVLLVMLQVTVCLLYGSSNGWSVADRVNYILLIFTDECPWYVGMYFGMLLLMPFLNLGWERLDRKAKQILLLSLLFICCARSFSTRFLYTYWVGLYAVLYYFLGAYLREYPLKLKQPVTAVLFCSVILLITLRAYVTSNGGVFIWNQFGDFQCDYNAFLVAMSTILFFTFISRLKIRTKAGKAFLRFIGKNTLGIYLLSGLIGARFLNPVLDKIELSWQSLPLWVLCSMLYCLIGAFFSELVMLLRKGANLLIDKIPKRRGNNAAM